MVQRWIEDADPELVVDLVPVGDIPAGWLPVLRAIDTDGTDVAVVHADNPALALLAGFDAVVNNADRKGSHVLPTADGRILGVDHGLCFHTDDKLRTILWGWAGPAAAGVGASTGSRGCGRTWTANWGSGCDELITTTEVARSATGWTRWPSTKVSPGRRRIARPFPGRRCERFLVGLTRTASRAVGGAGAGRVQRAGQGRRGGQGRGHRRDRSGRPPCACRWSSCPTRPAGR